MALTCFGQPSFETLKKDLEQKIMHCHFKEALNIINKNGGLYSGSAKIELDIMKMKILTELGLYDEAFKLSQNLVTNSQAIAEQKLKIHVERALIFEINNDYSSCIKELEKAENLISKYTNLSYFYLQKKQYRSATIYIDSVMAIVSKSNVQNYKADVYQTKSTILEQENKTDSALYYFKTATEYYKKYNSEQRDIKIKELETQYNFQKEKTEKQSLKKDIKSTRILNTTLIFSVFALALFVRQLMKNKRKIENQKKEISENNAALKTSLEEKQFLVQELNHRVKNNLAVILSLIDFQKEQEKNKEYKNRFDDLYQRIKTIMIAHELYTYSVNYNDHALVEARNYLDKIFETHQNSSIRVFTYINNAEAIHFTVDKILSLGLLVNELITNSIKHAQTLQELVLHLELKKTDQNQIEARYSDNGTIFKFEKNDDSLGLLIIEGMVKQLKGHYTREKAEYKIVFPND